MPTVIDPDSSAISAEQALMLVPEASAVADLAESGALACLADEFTTIDQEIHAARHQIARGLQETVEGWVRLAIALARMRSSRLYLARGYPHFAGYLKRCHDLSQDTALRLVRSLETLGPDTLRDLLTNVGVQRTYYLSQIQRLAPPLFEELLALPPVAGRSAVAGMEISELEQMVADVKAQLEQAYTDHAELADQLAAEQQLGRSITARLADIERVNQQLVTARDKAERELDHIKEQHTHVQMSALKKLRELERQNRDLQQNLHVARTAGRTAGSSPVGTAAVQEVISTCDSGLLADLMGTCVATLRRYRDLADHGAPDQVHGLYTAIADFIASGDLALVILVVRACATALRRYPDPAAVPPDYARDLYTALNEFGPAAVALYPEEMSNAGAR